MTPSEAIADLDDALTIGGTSMKLRRYTSTGTPRTFDENEMLGAFRSTKGEELAGHTDQFTGRVIISPTGLSMTPTRGDRIVLSFSPEYHVEVVKPFVIQGVAVRYELLLKGGV